MFFLKNGSREKSSIPEAINWKTSFSAPWYFEGCNQKFPPG